MTSDSYHHPHKLTTLDHLALIRQDGARVFTDEQIERIRNALLAHPPAIPIIEFELSHSGVLGDLLKQIILGIEDEYNVSLSLRTDAIIPAHRLSAWMTNEEAVGYKDSTR